MEVNQQLVTFLRSIMNNSLRVNSKNADNSSTSEAVFPKMCVPEKSALYVAQERLSQNGFLGRVFHSKNPWLAFSGKANGFKCFMHLFSPNCVLKQSNRFQFPLFASHGA